MGDALQVVEQGTKAFNAHDEAALRALYADDVVFEAPGGVRLEGVDAAMAYVASWLNAFPDAKLNVHSQRVAGDWVIQELTFEGTHTETMSSPQGDIPATNKRLAGRAADLFHVEGGRITAEHLYFDQMDVMTQLGLMPEPATAGAS